MNSIIALLFAVCLMAAAGHANGTRSVLIDTEKDDIEHIADHVCQHLPSYLNQISKISTISQLVDYLEGLPEDHKHANCSQRSLTALRELRDFLALDTSNVCSSSKISGAEQIHRQYIVAGNNPEASSHLPYIVQVFFSHYMYMLSSMCSAETYHHLKSLKSSVVPKSKLDGLINSLAVRTSSLRYQDIYLFWNLVQRMDVRKHPTVSRYINLDDDGRAHVSVGVVDMKNLNELQNACRTVLRPIYSRTLLSAIRLIDMGYNPRTSEFLDLINSNKQAKRLYELTKVCEALLPVRVVQLPPTTLNNNRLVVLSRQEVEQLTTGVAEPAEEVAVQEQCKKCSVFALDKLPTVFLNDAVEVATKIATSINDRISATGEILRSLVKRMKPGEISLFFSSRKSEKKFLDAEMEESMSHLDKSYEITDVHSFDWRPEFYGVTRDKLMYLLSFVWWLLSSHV